MEAEKQRSYLNKKYDILRQLTNQSDMTSVTEGMGRVNAWVEDVNECGRSESLVERSLNNFSPRGCSTPNRSNVDRSSQATSRQSPVLAAPANYNIRNSRRSILMPNPADGPLLRSSRFHTIPPDYDRASSVSQNPSSLHQNIRHGPTRAQLAARQAISKDLPMFCGNPEDWPIFLSSFNSTTSMCGFTNDENIIRLQRSLKGRAYDAVKSQLMHPANVPGVMGTLKMMFGQPEAIVNSLVTKINALPALREDKLETL
ncbi:hypothetical protein RP20_CCG013868 [Aedes albopictus]|nr:hypothetical protein RP20_CCG013868 [Aedes albopictus]